MTWRSILVGLALVASTMGSANAAELQIDKATIIGGRLVITGRTSVPNQLVVLVDTGDKTASLPSRRFSFDLTYLPETCKIRLKAGIEDIVEKIVSGCAPRGRDGKDGNDGRDGKDGKDGKDGIAGKDGTNGRDGKDGKDGRDGVTYGSLPGDGAAFQCWPSDLIGLWYIKDYPGPNSRTIAHIAPGLGAGRSKLSVTEPSNPLKAEKPEGPGVTRWAELNDAKLYILDREMKNRMGVRGEVGPDCKSIVWIAEGGGVLATWVR